MSSEHLGAIHESSDVKLSPQSPNMVSEEETATISIPTDPTSHKPDNSIPQTLNNSPTPEKSKKSSLLARSFRALGSMLGLSMISRSFKSKSNTGPDHNAQNSDVNEGESETEWADIVDNVVESDSGSEPADSYIEFMRHRPTKRRRLETSGRKFVRVTKPSWEQQRGNDVVEDGESAGDDANSDTSDSELSIPWFSSNP